MFRKNVRHYGKFRSKFRAGKCSTAVQGSSLKEETFYCVESGVSDHWERFLFQTKTQKKNRYVVKFNMKQCFLILMKAKF